VNVETARTAWDLVVAQARTTPREPAVRGRRECTYEELVERVEELAAAVRAGAAPGSVVAIEAAGSDAAAIATLAVMSAGCAALPLSTDSPPTHRMAMLVDARPAAFVQEDAGGALVVRVAPAGAGSGGRDLGEVAYVLYTSGSTGRPKGVLVPHSALLDRLAGLAEVPGLSPGESMVAMTPLSFDIAMAEILLPLVVGGSFVAAPPRIRVDPQAFAALVEEFEPDVIQATPSFWRLVLAAGWPGLGRSRLWCGGEPLTPVLAGELLPRCKELWNVYGPTEATIWALAARVEAAAPVMLGSPLPGTRMFLAGAEPGRPGEILLYGAGLALGYLGLEEQTARQFQVTGTPDGPRLCYRTGDLARYRADGSLEFLGRVDDQIKLRGHRIELGEIEVVLEGVPGVSEAAVVVGDADDPERAHLAAFLVAAAAVTESDVRAWVARHLPASMHPARIRMVSALPRTTSGKLDRAGLLGPTDRSPAS
jgi:D-alanine--poly(phosphoribitol) ligase subunit 1